MISYFVPKSQGFALGYRIFQFWRDLFGDASLYSQAVEAFKFIDYMSIYTIGDPISRDPWLSANGYSAILVVNQLWRQLLSASLEIAKLEHNGQARDLSSVQLLEFVRRNRHDPIFNACLEMLQHRPW